MSLIINETYQGNPYWLFNGQLQTLIPGLFRKVEGVVYKRQRLELSDGDFVDLDWSQQGSKKLVILLHGLEGNSSRQYILSAAKHFAENGWDVLSFNCRSCSEEINRNFKLYYHGETEDLRQVVDHVVSTQSYSEIVLSGYSMGGAMLSKYLSVHAGNLPAEIKCGISFSAPYDLEESIKWVEMKGNWIYNRLFRTRLKEKIILKDKQFPGRLDLSKIDDYPKWREFDAAYSAALNGFDNVDDFYYAAACKNFLHNLDCPLLIVLAKNDPIVSTTCIPMELCKRHPKIKLELTFKGGHVGFTMKGKPYNWMDIRALSFAEKLI